MDPLKRIVELLSDDSPRKRIAAAVVLGELAELASSKDLEVALLAIGRLGAMGGKVAEARSVGAALLEALAGKGRDKLALLKI